MIFTLNYTLFYYFLYYIIIYAYVLLTVIFYYFFFLGCRVIPVPAARRVVPPWRRAYPRPGPGRGHPPPVYAREHVLGNTLRPSRVTTHYAHTGCGSASTRPRTENISICDGRRSPRGGFRKTNDESSARART